MNRRNMPHNDVVPFRLRSCTPSGRLSKPLDDMFIADLRHEGYNETTIIPYAGNVDCFQRWMSYSNLRASIEKLLLKDLRDYLEFLDLHGVLYNSRRQKITTLRNLYTFAIKEKYVEKNLAKLLSYGERKPRQPRPVPTAVMDAYIAKAKKLELTSRSKRRYQILRAGMTTVYGSGLRVGEMRRLTYENIVLTEKRLGPHFDILDSKFGKNRKAPMNRDTLQAINDLSPVPLVQRTGLIFGKNSNVPFSHKTWDLWMKELQEGMVLTICYRWHDFRAACATQLALGKMGPAQISKIMGWDSFATAQVYINFTDVESFDAYHTHHPRGDIRLAQEESGVTAPQTIDKETLKMLLAELAKEKEDATT
jgi:site-specific recombinase XerD